MKLLFSAFLLFLGLDAVAQQKTHTLSISHYPNAELYLKADVVCRITDKSGRPSPNGKYLSIENKSGNRFSYSYLKATKSMQTVSPGKKVLIPIKDSNPFKSVPLKVKYTPVAHASSYQRLQQLRTMHTESDQLIFNKNTENPVKLPAADIVTSRKTKTVRKRPEAKRSSQNSLAGNVKEANVKVLPDSLKCIHTAYPSYYTFYYLKVQNDIVYSNVFAVPGYTLEEEAQELLDRAWLCFVSALRTHYSEQQVDAMLNDRDNDLQLGMLHLRDPFIPSSTIAERYPYTRSLEAAQNELESWIEAEKRKHKGLQLVKVIF